MADEALGRRSAPGETGQEVLSGHVTRPDEVAARAKLAALIQEHRDLDTAIEALSSSGSGDQLAVSRLKKRKLQLKDEITEINNSLLPDIIA